MHGFLSFHSAEVLPSREEIRLVHRCAVALFNARATAELLDKAIDLGGVLLCPLHDLFTNRLARSMIHVGFVSVLVAEHI